MAWPNTPLRTFLAGGLPYIDALTLNSLQTGINGIINATYSLAAVVVDGTGGSVVVPVAGTAKVSRTVVSNTYPSTAVAVGEYNRDAALACVAQLSGGFIPPLGAAGQGLTKGYGIKALNRLGAGQYEVTFLRQPSGGSTDNSVVQVTGYTGSGYPTIGLSIVAGDLVATIALSGGVDLPFFVTAWIW